MRDTAILVLAAGASRRMGPGRDKLAELVEGTPLLTLICQRALATGEAVYACLPGPDHPRCQMLPDAVTPVYVPDAASGMSASIRRGTAALAAGTKAVMILPADMPELTAADLRNVLNAHEDHQITRGSTSDHTPGHPVVFPASCFTALQTLRGDRGARGVIAQFSGQTRLVELPGTHALTDLDTPADWQAWRRSPL